MRFDASGLRTGPLATRLDAFDPRSRVLCALALTFAMGSVPSLPALAAAVPIPLLLLFSGEMGMWAKSLLRLNAVGFWVGLLLALTWPGERLWGIASVAGLEAAALFLIKLNLISVLLIRMVVPLGVERVENALARLGVPEKLRVLLLLSTRCIFILAERMETLVRAVRLRGPDLKGLLRYRTLACMLGATLLHGSDRAERTMLAIRCRGGLAGFSQCPPLRWRGADTLLCLSFGLNIAAIFLCSLIGRA